MGFLEKIIIFKQTMDVEDVFYEENEEASRKKIKENEEKMLMAEFSQVFIVFYSFSQ